VGWCAARGTAGSAVPLAVCALRTASGPRGLSTDSTRGIDSRGRRGAGGPGRGW
jgi:hypothetical protein